MSPEHKIDSDEESETQEDPTRELTGRRVFYRSNPRQRLTFVPASNDSAAGSQAKSVDAASLYEAIVLKHRQQPSDGPAGEESEEFTGGAVHRAASEPALFPLVMGVDSGAATPDTERKATLAHQVGLEHSHPPSHLDRTGKGFRYLASYGWDADARVGLGPEGEGVRAPLKPVQKNNTMGIGLELMKKKSDVRASPPLLDAGKVRKQYARQQKQDSKLREMIYGDGKVERYLGERRVSHDTAAP